MSYVCLHLRKHFGNTNNSCLIFRDRTTVPLFTRYMIAIVNNCELFEELGQELKSRWWKPGQHDSEATIKFENLLSIFQNLKQEAAGFLLDEAFLDIEIQFAKIMTPEWARPEATEAIDTVATTMEDYFEDYNYLRCIIFLKNSFKSSFLVNFFLNFELFF